MTNRQIQVSRFKGSFKSSVQWIKKIKSQGSSLENLKNSTAIFLLFVFCQIAIIVQVALFSLVFGLNYYKGASLVAQTVNESACNSGNLGSIPGLGISTEKRMATHSSILAWRIPCTWEPGQLCPWGSQRVRQDQAIITFTFFNYYRISHL